MYGTTNWKSTYRISVSEIEDIILKKLRDKLPQIEAGEAVPNAKGS